MKNSRTLPLLLALLALCGLSRLSAAQDIRNPAPAFATKAEPVDPMAPTHRVKSAEEIDREWQVSISKFDARRDALLQEADRQAHDGPYRPDWEALGNHEIPQWFKDAMFGIFIGWGVYAVPGAVLLRNAVEIPL